MKNENRKKSNSRPALLVYASCNGILLLITMFIAYLSFICGAGIILEGISERNGFNIGLLLPVFVFAFFIASLFAVRGYFERMRNHLARYSRIGEERKRIERLIQKDNSQISDDNILVDAQDNDNIKEHSQH